MAMRKSDPMTLPAYGVQSSAPARVQNNPVNFVLPNDQIEIVAATQRGEPRADALRLALGFAQIDINADAVVRARHRVPQQMSRPCRIGSCAGMWPLQHCG